MVVEPLALDTSTCTNSADTFVHKPKRGHLNCLLKSIGERHLPAQSVSIKFTVASCGLPAIAQLSWRGLESIGI